MHCTLFAPLCALVCTSVDLSFLLVYNMGMSKAMDISNWFESVRRHPVPKFITGLRGTGKTVFLLRLRDKLLAEGVPPANILFVDTSDPALRQYATHEQMIDHILSSLPRKEKSYIFIREAAALPDAEVVIGTLAASLQLEIVATSSSRRLLDRGLARYFSSRLAHFEILPPDSGKPYAPEAAMSRWNEIFLHDVLAPKRILEVTLAGRIAGWLSDNLGDATSLRIIAAAISPAGRLLSPHTIESYLESLEDAHLVEKTIRWDIAEEAPQKTGYKYFFTDPQLRRARFGPAPTDEARRMALNLAWLRLSHSEDEVFTASGMPEVHFVTRSGRNYSRWQMTADGSLKRHG